jgi:hypothetical protein
MMIHGYCEQCQRIKRVKPRTSFLAAGVIRGICADCEEADRERRKVR